MTRPVPLLQLVMVVVMACGGDAVTDSEPGTRPAPPPQAPPAAPPPLPPPAAPAFALLHVSPPFSDLVTFAPANSTRLILVAFDQSGEHMAIGGAPVTYSSDAANIVTVSSEGVATAVTPGNATITATVTLGGITRTGSMTVTVHDFSGLGATYDLTAVVTSFDAAWGYDLAGYRYTAVIMLDQQSDPLRPRGMYSDLRVTSPSGDSSPIAAGGVIVGSTDGRLIIELLGDGDHIGLTLIVATLDANVIDGQFGCCGHIGGTFTAQRK